MSKADVTIPAIVLQPHANHTLSEQGCGLCQRQIALTFHHLIPRKMHRRPYFQKHYSKAQLAAGVMLCQLCHKAVHRCYDEMTLAKQFNTLELLRADPQLQRHLIFAQKQRRKR